MQIDGSRNPGRLRGDRADETRRGDRAEEARRSDRTDSRPADPRGPGSIGDSVETEVAAFVDRSVADARTDLDERLRDVESRREELLARADDPAAVRRAARRFLAEGF